MAEAVERTRGVSLETKEALAAIAPNLLGVLALTLLAPILLAALPPTTFLAPQISVAWPFQLLLSLLLAALLVGIRWHLVGLIARTLGAAVDAVRPAPGAAPPPAGVAWARWRKRLVGTAEGLVNLAYLFVLYRLVATPVVEVAGDLFSPDVARLIAAGLALALGLLAFAALIEMSRLAGPLPAACAGLALSAAATIFPSALTGAVDLAYLARYENDAAWFRFGGKPFVVFYGTRLYDVATWGAVCAQVDPSHQDFWMGEGDLFQYLTVFDGIHPYSIAWSPNPAGQLASYAQRTRAYAGKAWMATAMPGYNDVRINGAQGFAVDRQNGAYYQKTWQGAVATNPDLINITSFNEWREGSMIEPSKSYGDLYLNLTRQLVGAYRGGAGCGG